MPLARAFLLALLIPALVPQTTAPTGTVAGRVADESGRLPGANVTIALGNWSRSTFADGSGRYRFEEVPTGVYTEWFSLAGFATEARRSLNVEAGVVVTVDALLRISGQCDHCVRPPLPNPPRVRVETTLGSIDIIVELYRAPLTAGNFLEYVDRGFYDYGRLHRATRVDNYTVALPSRPLLECIQAGTNPARKPDALPPIPLERTSVTGLNHVTGTVSMARGAGADTATSDFFILLNDQPSLDFGGKRFDDGQGAAAFGRVIAGMDVVRKIQQQPTKAQSLEPPITILSARRVVP